MQTVPVASKRYSIDDLGDFPDDGKRRELVDGCVVEWEMPNVRHNFVLNALVVLLNLFARQHRLGTVLPGDTMVRILGSEHDARGADVAFYTRGRFPSDIDASATMNMPDFVIEILSPSDRATDVQEKVRDWLRAGVKLLWYVNPLTGTTSVYEGKQTWHVGADEMLDAAEILPGFTVRMRDVLNELATLESTEESDSQEEKGSTRP